MVTISGTQMVRSCFSAVSPCESKQTSAEAMSRRSRQSRCCTFLSLRANLFNEREVKEADFSIHLYAENLTVFIAASCARRVTKAGWSHWVEVLP